MSTAITVNTTIVSAKKPISKYVSDFTKNIDNARRNVFEAAKAYADAINAHGDEAHVKFTEKYPSVSSSTWETLRYIGLGALPPGAVFVSDAMRRKLLTIPTVRQHALLSHKTFNVLDSEGHRRRISAARITDDQLVQILDDDGNLIEQPQQVTLKPAWVIADNKFVVKRKASFTKEELKVILSQIE